MASPVIKKKLIRGNTDFNDAMKEVVEGNKVTREAWGNPAEYLLLNDGFLCVHHSYDEEGVVHRLMVHKEDIVGKDWQVIIEQANVKH